MYVHELQKEKEDLRLPGVRVADVEYELQCGCWQSISNLLQDEPNILSNHLSNVCLQNYKTEAIEIFPSMIKCSDTYHFSSQSSVRQIQSST